MPRDVAAQVSGCLGDWSAVRRVTDRRGAQVWRVTLAGGDEVAVKAADAGPSGLLPVREAAVIRSAGPVAGTVLGSGRLAQGGSWMAAPWWRGPTLWTAFNAVRDDPPSLPARAGAACASVRAACALARLHERGWAHGDVQAGHVILADGGTRLLDLAWAHGPEGAVPAEFELAYSGALVHLEAPEIAGGLLNGETVVPTPSADVYTFGGVLWSCCSGVWPVDYGAAGVDPAPGNLTAKRQAVASGRWLRDHGTIAWAELAGLLGAAMAPHPQDRPTARELAGALRVLAGREPVG